MASVLEAEHLAAAIGVRREGNALRAIGLEAACVVIDDGVLHVAPDIGALAAAGTTTTADACRPVDVDVRLACLDRALLDQQAPVRREDAVVVQAVAPVIEARAQDTARTRRQEATARKTRAAETCVVDAAATRVERRLIDVDAVGAVVLDARAGDD